MTDEPNAMLPSSTRDEMILDTTGTLVNLVPLLGGPIASILLGISGDRRFERVRQFLIGLDSRVGELSDEQDVFVRSEDFEDLLTETLTRVARERSEEKRRIYRDFLASVVEDPGEPYDEQLRFLRVLEQLQADHVEMLRAIIQDPGTDTFVVGGSRMQTLRSRLQDLAPERVEDLAVQLADHRIIDEGMLQGIVSGRGAVDLRPTVTPFGERFVRFLSED